MKKRESVIICPLLCISLLLTALVSPLAVPVSVYAAAAASNTGEPLRRAGTEAEVPAVTPGTYTLQVLSDRIRQL